MDKNDSKEPEKPEGLEDSAPKPGEVIDATEKTEDFTAEGADGKKVETDSKPVEPVKPAKKSKVPAPLRKFYEKFNIYFLMFILMLIAAGFVLAIAALNSKKASQGQPESGSLDQAALEELQGTDAKVGDSKQQLTIESNAVFSGKVLVKGGLDVAGTIKVGGPLALSGITVAGTSSFDELSVNTLNVAGNTTINGQLSVQKNLAVSGSGSFKGSLSAQSLVVENFQINRDLQINRHIDAGGSTPKVAGGGAIGNGGTVSINGSDSGGTVTINTGGSPSGGLLATVTFASAFTTTPHVVVTPVGISAAGLNYYISRTSTGFTLNTTNSPPAGSNFSFDFVAID